MVHAMEDDFLQFFHGRLCQIFFPTGLGIIQFHPTIPKIRSKFQKTKKLWPKKPEKGLFTRPFTLTDSVIKRVSGATCSTYVRTKFFFCGDSYSPLAPKNTLSQSKFEKSLFRLHYETPYCGYDPTQLS